MKASLLALTFVQAVVGECYPDEIWANRGNLPDLSPHAPSNLKVKNGEMSWGSRVSNLSNKGHFIYVNDKQILEADGGRKVCEQQSPMLKEEFTVFTKKGIFVSKAIKEVTCLMDSEGGSEAEAHFHGGHCREKIMGISASGTDFYSSATKAQRLKVDRWPPGEYFLVNKLKNDKMIQGRWSNDLSWTRFILENKQYGRVEVKEIEGCNGWNNCEDRLDEAFDAANRAGQYPQYQYPQH